MIRTVHNVFSTSANTHVSHQLMVHQNQAIVMAIPKSQSREFNIVVEFLLIDLLIEVSDVCKLLGKWYCILVAISYAELYY